LKTLLAVAVSYLPKFNGVWMLKDSILSPVNVSHDKNLML